MAFYCTNFLAGSDTTGNGSAVAPYKTINKALSVCSNGDEVRVIGQRLQATANTATVTARATTITVNGTMPSIVAGNIIALDTSSVDGWSVDKTLYYVDSVAGNVLTVTGQSIAIPPGTYPLYWINETLYPVQYSTNSASPQETIASFTATNVSVTGGWDSTYTNQYSDAYTIARYTVGTTGSATFISHSNIIKPDVIFDKFIMANTSFSSTTSSASIGINRMWFIRTGNTFGTSNYGVYGADGSTGLLPANIVACNVDLTTTWNGSANKPSTLLLNQWITSSTNNRWYMKCGYILTPGLSTGPQIRTLSANIRTSGTSQNIVNQAIIRNGTFFADIFIDELNIYLNSNVIIPIIDSSSFSSAGWRYIGNINTFIYGSGDRSGIIPSQNIINASTITSYSPLNVNKTNGTLDSLAWRIYGTDDLTAVFSKLGATDIYGKDTEGQKVINGDIIPKWADTTTFATGSNSLRMKLLTNTTGLDRVSYICGTLTKPSSNFTVTIKAKASKAVSVEDVRLLYGSGATQFASLGAINLTTSWQDFTFNVTPASYSTWTFGDDGLMSIFLRITTSVVTESENQYIWIDSVTVS